MERKIGEKKLSKRDSIALEILKSARLDFEEIYINKLAASYVRSAFDMADEFLKQAGK